MSICNLEDDFEKDRVLVKPDFERVNELLPTVYEPGSEDCPFITGGVPLRALADVLFEQFQAHKSPDKYDYLIPFLEGESGKSFLCRKALALILSMKLAASRDPFVAELKNARTLMLSAERIEENLMAATLDAVYDQWGIRLDGQESFVDCIAELAKRGPMLLCMDGLGSRYDSSERMIEFCWSFYTKTCSSLARIPGVYLILSGCDEFLEETDLVRPLMIKPVKSGRALDQVLEACHVEIDGVTASVASHLKKRGVEDREQLYDYMVGRADGRRDRLFEVITGIRSSWFKKPCLEIPRHW